MRNSKGQLKIFGYFVAEIQDCSVNAKRKFRT